MWSQAVRRSVFCLAVVAAAAPVLAGTPVNYYGGANLSSAPDNYHFQITTYYCGPASIEMQLDSTAWRNSLTVTPAQIANQSIQNNIYAISHGASQAGWATDPNGLLAGLNAYTAPAFAGSFQLDVNTPDAITPTNKAPWNTASRNIANALELTGAPVTALINQGQHWIDVYKVLTTAPPTVDGNYKIYGFYIRDPWSGPGTLGYNTYLANNGRGWGRYFTPVRANLAPFAGKYYSVTDPPALDDGSFDSEPDPSPIIPTITTGTTAATDAGADLSNDSDLASQAGFDEPTGHFSAADAELEHYFDDAPGQGDWMVPYEDSSLAVGSDPADISGFELIDETTGMIDQATWFDPGTDMDLSDLNAELFDEFNGDLPTDALPEPASLGLLMLGAPLLMRRRSAER